MTSALSLHLKGTTINQSIMNSPQTYHAVVLSATLDVRSKQDLFTTIFDSIKSWFGLASKPAKNPSELTYFF